MPAGVVVPNNDASSFSLTCASGCTNAAAAAFSYSSSTRLLSITEAFAAYTPAGTTIKISITGWTNPIDAESYSFSIATFAYIDNVMYGLENFTGNMSIKANAGLCSVLDIFVTDDDTRIYAQPKSYTFEA